MKTYIAREIFAQIDSEDYTVEEKGEAIQTVLQMESHKRVTKPMMLEVMRWLLNLAFDAPGNTR